MGVHAGETVATAEGLVGSAVNIAARLCAEAKAGELVVSDTVRALTRTQIDVRFEPLGTRRLKGVAEPVACYRVLRGGAGIHDPATRPVGRRSARLLAAGLGAAAVVALVAAGAVVLFGGGRAAGPSPNPSTAAAAGSPAGASTSPGASTDGSSEPPAASAALPTLEPFPGLVEKAILATLPSALAKTCERGGTLVTPVWRASSATTATASRRRRRDHAAA